MPANQKEFSDITPDEFNVFRSRARSKGWVPPNGGSGYLRGPGIMADLNYDEKHQRLHVRVREIDKGTTYSSFFNEVEGILKNVDR